MFKKTEEGRPLCDSLNKVIDFVLKLILFCLEFWACLVGHMVKNPPAVRETWV